MRTRSGNIALSTVNGGTNVRTDAGAMRINAANAVLITGGSVLAADSRISPSGDLIINAKALYALAGSTNYTGVFYGVNGASTTITLSGNPVAALSQPTNYTLYLYGANLRSTFIGNMSPAANVNITLASGNAVIDGTNGSDSSAAQLTFYGTNGNTFTLQNGNFSLRAGDGQSSGAYMGTGGGGQLDMTVNGSALIQGSAMGTASAFVGTDPGLNLRVLGPNGNLSLIAGNSASSLGPTAGAGISTQNGSIQEITVEGTLLLKGGTLPQFDASIYGPTQIIKAGTLVLQNGTAGGASIGNAGGNQATYTQTITVTGNATIGTPSGTAGLAVINHGGSSPQTLIVGKSLLVNPTGLITTRSFSSAVTTIVVDNENAARPNRNMANTLINNGTLDIRAVSQIHAVNPASTTLGTYVPGATLFNHWYGEAGAVNGVNYKSFADGGFLAPQTLTVTKSGNGTVTSSPAGINCGATCSASLTANTLVALTASATSGSTFIGWTGACTGVATCTVTMDAAKSVNAAFAQLAVVVPSVPVPTLGNWALLMLGLAMFGLTGTAVRPKLRTTRK